MNQILADRRILVTGAARGLGEAFARGAAYAGASLVLTDILEKPLTEVTRSLVAQGHQAESFFMDLSDPASIDKAMSQIGGGGALDGLVNNAAIATQVGGKSMVDHDIELWDRVMTVNVRGTMLVTRSAVPLLIESGCGRVVNIASDTALWGAPKLMAYVASKGAVLSMTRSMSRELGESDICVNAIAPGLTRCEATEYVPAERYEFYERGRALKREQKPGDVVGTALYLLSDLAAFVTGQTVPVNGGFVCS